MNEPENPPAFPRADAGWSATHDGITLRDWFAGQALAGQLAFSPSDEFEKFHMPEDVARACYRFADAMLAARPTPDTAERTTI